MTSACEALGRRINIMEVCGTHTVSIFRNGIRSILPKDLRLLSGVRSVSPTRAISILFCNWPVVTTV